MSKRQPRTTQWEKPISLPIWVIAYEVWKGEQPYRMGTMRIPAETQAEAQEAVELVLRDLMPNLFLDAEIRLTSALICETK